MLAKILGYTFLVIAMCGVAEAGPEFIYPVGRPDVRPTADLSSLSSNGYRVTRGFMESNHTGVDLANGNEDGEVRPISDGVVAEVRETPLPVGFGNLVRIRHTVPGIGTVYSQYAHLQNSSIQVIKDQIVSVRTVIARVNCSGYIEPSKNLCRSNGRSGPHLHLSVQVMDRRACGYLPDKRCPSDTFELYFDPLQFIEDQRRAPVGPELVFDGSNDVAQSVIAGIGIDSGRTFRLLTIQTTSGGLRLHSVSANGPANAPPIWSTGFLAGGFGIIGMSLAPGDRTYVFHDTRLFAIDSAGRSILGWPQMFNVPGIFVPAGPIAIDPNDGTVFAKLGANFVVSSSVLVGIFARRPDGSPGWDTTYGFGQHSWALVRGPGGDLYTAIGIGPTGVGPAFARFVRLNKSTGAETCSATIVSDFDQLVGGSTGIFTSAVGTITSYDLSCNGSPLFTTDRVFLSLLGYNEVAQTVVGIDFGRALDGNLDPLSRRLIGVPRDGSRAWRNEGIFPAGTSFGSDNPIRAQRGGRLYVVGTQVLDGRPDRIFVVNAATGDIVGFADTNGICPSCDIAVGLDGTIYFTDRTLKIYKVRPTS